MRDPVPMTAAIPSTATKIPLRVAFALCTIVGGLQLAEEISNNVLPLTLRRFTSDASIIGMILAIHPLFGFIAQPVVGILGDRIWTRVGRRAFFLVVVAPLAAICLWIFPTLGKFGEVVAMVVVFQLFLALLWGSDHPLITDLVPSAQRTIVKGWMMCSAFFFSFLFIKYGVGRSIDRWGEVSVYRFVAIALIVLVAFAALFLNESRVTPAVRPKLTLRRYFSDLLGDPILRKFALLAFIYSTFVNAVIGFAVLFAVQTVQISKTDFGAAWSWKELVSLVCAVPVGYGIQRLPKQWALVAGFLIALVGCIFGYFAHDAAAFYPLAILFGFGWLVVEVTMKPFFSEFLPKDIVGQLTGAWNICYAAGRITALVGGGWLISSFGNDYRVIWLVAIVFGVLSAAIASSIPDSHHRQREDERKVAAAAVLQRAR